MKTVTKVSTGEIIFFSDGCYSDYGYCGKVVFIKDCDLSELLAIYHAAQKELYEKTDDYSDKPSANGFVSWLCAGQLCVTIEAREIHLGEYGELQISGA